MRIDEYIKELKDKWSLTEDCLRHVEELMFEFGMDVIMDKKVAEEVQDWFSEDEEGV